MSDQPHRAVAWTPEERIKAMRGTLERIRDGGEPLPRATAWVLLDFLDGLAADVEALRASAEQ